MRTFLKLAGVITAVLTLIAAIIGLRTVLLQDAGETSNPNTNGTEISKTFKVSAQRGWQNTEITLRSGQKLMLLVESGSWTDWLDNNPLNNGEGNLGKFALTCCPL